MMLKGALPLLILRVLSHEPRHGYAIAQTIKQRSAGLLDFKEGTLYPLLHALESRALITSFLREESGRTRRYYQLTEAGHTALAQDRQTWKQYVHAVELVLEGEA